MSTELECERRFLVDPSRLEDDYSRYARYMIQGYLLNEHGRTLRVRLTTGGCIEDRDKWFLWGAPAQSIIRYLNAGKSANLFQKCALTLKEDHSYATRKETETEIPVVTGLALLSDAQAILVKKRTTIGYQGKTWEIDEYAAPLRGVERLIVAEVEMDISERYNELQIPDWCSLEITDEPSYSNAALAYEPQ